MRGLVAGLLIPRAAALCIAFTLMGLAARAFGGMQPPSAVLDQLHLTDCALPCWMGIVPGTSSHDDVVAQMADAGTMIPSADSQQNFFQLSDGKGSVNVAYSAASSIVRTLEIFPATIYRLRFGDAAALLGLPSCVFNMDEALVAVYDTPGSYKVIVTTSFAGQPGFPWERNVRMISIATGDTLCKNR